VKDTVESVQGIGYIGAPGVLGQKSGRDRQGIRERGEESEMVSKCKDAFMHKTILDE